MEFEPISSLPWRCIALLIINELWRPDTLGADQPNEFFLTRKRFDKLPLYNHFVLKLKFCSYRYGYWNN